MIKSVNQKKGFIMGFVFLGIGLLGGIIFFPVNLNSRYTCLYHRIFTSDNHSYTTIHNGNQNNQSSDILPDESSGSSGQSNSLKELGSEHSELLQRYILPFGFFWWISLTILVIGSFVIRKNFLKRKKLSTTYKKL